MMGKVPRHVNEDDVSKAAFLQNHARNSLLRPIWQYLNAVSSFSIQAFLP